MDDCYFHRELGGGGANIHVRYQSQMTSKLIKKYSFIIFSHLMLVLLLKGPHSSEEM